MRAAYDSYAVLHSDFFYIERNMCKRSSTKITEIRGCDVIFISQPAAVANVIVTAAEGK
jgi:hypothetical protein